MAVVHVTTDNFEQEVMQSEKPVLIDFWAGWCGPCMMLGPVVEELAEEVTDVKICKVNVDEQMDLAQQFKVVSIPMLILIKNGRQEQGRAFGVYASVKGLKKRCIF